MLSSSQRSVLLGTLLGDAALHPLVSNRKPQLTIGHGSKQQEYLLWKVDQLKPLFNTNPRRYDYGRGVYYQLSSASHPVLDELAPMIYIKDGNSHRKVITQELLSKIDDLALAIWWCDDGVAFKGSANRKTSLGIALGGLSENEHLLVKQWLEGFGYKISMYRGYKSCVILRLNNESSIPFARRIREHVPQCMRPKMKDLAYGS